MLEQGLNSTRHRKWAKEQMALRIAERDKKWKEGQLGSAIRTIDRRPAKGGPLTQLTASSAVQVSVLRASGFSLRLW
jgi:hypothetical protein